MHKLGFSEAIEQIIGAEPAYDREAYHFLREALEHAAKMQRKGKEGTPRHVTAAELLEGLREHALHEFGPMVPTVFEYWGIRNCEDIGRMVFQLIERGVFGKTEHDSLEDFRAGFDFRTAFVEPFLPPTKPPVPESDVRPIPRNA